MKKKYERQLDFLEGCYQLEMDLDTEEIVQEEFLLKYLKSILEKQFIKDIRDSPPFSLDPNPKDPQDNPETLIGYFRNLGRTKYQLEQRLHEKEEKIIEQVKGLEAQIERVEKNKKREIEHGIMITVKETVLPLFDAYELIINAVKKYTNEEGEVWVWIKHLEPNYKRIQKKLDKLGITALEVKEGDKFNEEFHTINNAVPATEEFSSGTITKVTQKGFLYKGRIMRTARVQIAK